MEAIALRSYNRFLKHFRKLLGVKLTYTGALFKLGKQLFGTKFKAVIPSDRIPILDNHQSYCIVNVDKTGMSGTHWLAMAFRDGYIYVYDSYGRPTRKLIPNSFQKNMIDTDYDAEQTRNQDDCGQRCLAWLSVFDTLGPNYALTI